jgi:hypothetical protein
MPRTFAYVRVSTAGQTTENQIQEIEAAGFKVETRRVVSETVSGSGCDNEYWPTCADEYWPTPRVSDLLSRAEARLSRSVCFVLPVMVSFPFAAPWCGGTDRSPSLW